MTSSVGISKTSTAEFSFPETSAAVSAFAMFALHIAHCARAETVDAPMTAARLNTNLTNRMNFIVIGLIEMISD